MTAARSVGTEKRKAKTTSGALMRSERVKRRSGEM